MQKIKNPWAHLEGYNCFGCAPNNNAGVKMEFYEEGDEVVSIWKPQPQFQGWYNTLHWGIQSLLMDEAAAWVVTTKLQTTGVTSKMETRFRKPVYTTDTHLTIRASIVEQKRNVIILKAAIYNQSDELCADSALTFFTFSPEKAKEMLFGGSESE